MAFYLCNYILPPTGKSWSKGIDNSFILIFVIKGIRHPSIYHHVSSGFTYFQVWIRESRRIYHHSITNRFYMINALYLPRQQVQDMSTGEHLWIQGCFSRHERFQFIQFRKRTKGVVCLEDGTLAWYDQGTEGIAHQLVYLHFIPPSPKDEAGQDRRKISIHILYLDANSKIRQVCSRPLQSRQLKAGHFSKRFFKNSTN